MYRYDSQIKLAVTTEKPSLKDLSELEIPPETLFIYVKNCPNLRSADIIQEKFPLLTRLEIYTAPLLKLYNLSTALSLTKLVLHGCNIDNPMTIGSLT